MPPEHNFFRAKSFIEESTVLQVLRKMPKGAGDTSSAVVVVCCEMAMVGVVMLMAGDDLCCDGDG